MVSRMNWKSWTILGLSLAIMVASSGLMMASNLGFKINKALVNNFSKGPKGDNWLSLPYTNPYANTQQLCSAFTSQGATASAVIPKIWNAGGGSFVGPATCAAVVGHVAINSKDGVRVEVTGTSISNIVLVGSSDESAALSTFNPWTSPSSKNEVWISVPYHTTWINAEDPCVTFGWGNGQGQISRSDPTTGSVTTHGCSLATNRFAIVIGESIRVRNQTLVAKSGVLPPHF